MITYIKRKILVDKPISVTCDVCGRNYNVNDLEVQEFEHIRRAGGYDSVFGDSVLVSADICQHCLKELLGAYLHEENIPSDPLYA